MIAKKSKYKSVVIKKKRYYFYKITWVDPTGDSGHANAHDSLGLTPSKMVTHAYLFHKDKKNICDYNLESIDFLHKFRNKKIDLVDLDPYGSCFECFDYALKIAQKGLIITFGEVGHKRWKRSDFVEHRYNIKTINDFSNKKFINYIIERSLIFNKKLTPIFQANFKNILRVYFEIKIIKKSNSGKKYFTQ